MTDEQRKAVIEKVAVQMLACVLSEPPKKAKAELRRPGEWRTRWFDDAAKVLESVGYFGLVEAAEALVKAYGEHEFRRGDPEYGGPYWSPAGRMIDTEVVVALEVALKEAV